MISDQISPQHPFFRIGLSLSGGGYRAASFHLGTFSYLNHAQWYDSPLLDRVAAMSTVSGGTITGMVYALQRQEERTFDDFFNFLIEKLKDLDLLKLAFQKLGPEGHWNHGYKKKNLINAFAEIYDEHFTFGQTLDVFRILPMQLNALYFNTTEFAHGINFRFQNPPKSNGNQKIRIPSDLTPQIKLSDIIAASSCFPGGFEPLIWPNDFGIVGYENPQYSQGIGLMDGGIYDNQGIDSLLKYDKSTKGPLDLIIVSDVSSPVMEQFISAPVEKKFKKTSLNGLIKISRRINLAMIFIIVSCILLPVLTGFKFPLLTGFCLGIILSFGILLLVKLLAINQLSTFLRQHLKRIVGDNYHFYFEKIKPLNIHHVRFSVLAPLIADRLVSLKILIKDVFLKNIRRLHYNRLYDDASFKLRRLTCVIGALRKENYKTTKSPKIPDMTDYDAFVGPLISSVVHEASSVGTTLWFTEQEKANEILYKLIATGQMTMCFNLINYLNQWLDPENEEFDRLSFADQDMLRTLYKNCLQDWNSFRAEPMWMLLKL